MAVNIISKDRDNNFNFLRLISAILVLLSHSPELKDGNRSREILTVAFGTISFGELAVQVFFLLSGYMIIKSWTLDPNLAKYIKKRVSRIFPGFIVATLISIFLVGWLGASNKITYFHDVNYLKAIFNIFALVGPYTPEVFKNTHYPTVNAPMWTLSYEFRCYMTVAIFGIYGINTRRYSWLITLIIMLILLFSCSFFDINKYHFPGSFYLLGVPSSIITLFTCFTTGVCYYLYRDNITYKPILCASALALLIFSLFFHHFAPISFCLLGGYCAFFIAFKQIRFLKIFQKLPDASYGIYLYGWPVQKILLWYHPSLSPWLLFIMALIATVILGLASWYVVESPALKLIKKRL